MNSNSLKNKQKQKQTNNMKTEFQKLSVKLSFLCRITNIKIVWINTSKIYIKSSDVSTKRCFLLTNVSSRYLKY